MAVLQKQHDALAAQQSHWEDMRHTSEQIDALADLISQADQRETDELRTLRDRTHALESDKAGLALRLKEQQGKTSANEKAIVALRGSLSQAQERAKEWENRANESQQYAEEARDELAEATEAKLEAESELSSMNMAAHEKDAHERLTKVSLLFSDLPDLVLMWILGS